MKPCYFWLFSLCKQALSFLLYCVVVYLSWKDGLVTGGTLGSKNPVEEVTNHFSVCYCYIWCKIIHRL